MENASKALIMAGSVLLALLIIGLLVLMFNSLGNFKTGENNNRNAIKLAEYNKQILKYNRDLYGSELVSLANLIEDYNIREVDLKGYEPIDIKIYTNNLDGFKNLYTNVKDLIDDYNFIENKLNGYKEVAIVAGINVGKSVQDWYGMTDLQQDAYLQNLQVTKRLTLNNIYQIKTKMDTDKEDYSNYRAILNTFKNRKFEPTIFDDSTGRVTRIEFKLK